MPYAKPFYRNYRGLNYGPNDGYSSWGYIIDHEYAKDPEHYVRALLLIQENLKQIFEFIEPSDESRLAYSYRIHALFMRTCIEIEANFKAILAENKFTPRRNTQLGMIDYRKVDATHHLSTFEVVLPVWNGPAPILRPFHPWKALRGLPSSPVGTKPVGVKLPWYSAHNESKHDRHVKFKQANLGNLIQATAALLVLVSAQFHEEEFSAGHSSLALSGPDYEYHPMKPSIGSLFRITEPDDWLVDEMYAFDWSKLKAQTDRFAKFDYDAIPW